MTWLIVISCIAGYFLIGAFYARSRAVDVYKSAKKQWDLESIVRESTALRLTWRLLLWPIALIIDTCRGGLSNWMYRDLNQRRDQAAQLREDANAWLDKRHTGTPAEREMADELYRLCKERAEEVDG